MILVQFGINTPFAVFPLMQLNVNTYANSIIESSFTLRKFVEVLMNVYLRYSFNC